MKKLFSKLPELKGKRLLIRPLATGDAADLKKMTESEEVYRFLPTFLFENKYEDKEYVISHLYDECLEDSLILGVFCEGEFCGLAEMYAYRPMIKKISVGVRFIKKYWGAGVASEALELMVDYLFSETDIKLIAASTMTENKNAGNVLKKQGFRRAAHGIYENWGFDKPVAADVWLKTYHEHRMNANKPADHQN